MRHLLLRRALLVVFLAISVLVSVVHFTDLQVTTKIGSRPKTDSRIWLRDAQHPGHVVEDSNRASDVSDAFRDYIRYPDCNVSSPDLHEPIHPLCASNEAVLAAMSGGGRAGIDMPYIPRGCDMRWFTQTILCELLSRFSAVTIAGDSMMRNLAIAIHTYLRRDIRDGTLQNWLPDSPGLDCHCAGVFFKSDCWKRGAQSTSVIWRHDPENAMLNEWPIVNDAKSLTLRLPNLQPTKPHVFVFGHGLWNNVNETASLLWLDQAEAVINRTMPWLTELNAIFPRLFITPNSAGLEKPEKYIATQGNMALSRFEMAMGPAVRKRGFDHLGLYNLTLQNTSPDGTHAGFHANLVKAMMVFNWMSWIDVGDQSEVDDY